MIEKNTKMENEKNQYLDKINEMDERIESTAKKVDTFTKLKQDLQERLSNL